MGKNATITIKTIFEKANTSAIVNQIKKDKEAIEKAGTTNVPVNFDFNNKDFNAALQNLNKGLTAKNMAGLDFSKQMMEVIQLMSSPNMAIEEKTSEINKIAESFKLISSSKGGFITAQDRELFKQMNSNQLSRVMEEIAKIRDEEVRNTKLKEQNDIYKYSKYYDLGNGDEKVGSNFYNALLKGKVYDRIEGKEEADPLIPKTKLKPQRTTIGAFGNDLGINYNKALERALSEHREDLSAEDIAKSKDVIEKRIKEYGTIIRRIEETFETFNDLHEKTDFESMTKKAGLIRRMGALYSIAEEQEKNLKKLDNKANANGAIGIDETKFFTKAEEGEFADIRKNIISTIGSNSLNRKDITALFNDVRKEIQDSFLSEDTPELAAAKQHYRDFISTYAKTTVARVTTAAAEILDGELASASNKQVTPDASSQTGQAVQSIEKPIEEAIPKIDLVHSTNLKKEDIEIDDPKELIKQINDISAELDKSLYPTKGKPTAPSQELLYKYKALIGRAEYLNDKLSKQGISSFDKQFDEIFDKDYEYFENFFDPDKKNELIGSAQREVMEDLYANASKNAIGPFLRKNFSPLPTDAELKKFESVQSKGEPPKESELKAEEVISTKVDEKLDKATESAEKTTEELNQMAEKLKESEENAKSLQKNLDDLGDEYSKLNEEKKKVENDLSTAQKNKDDLENKIRKVTGAGTDEDLNTLLSKIEKVDTSEKANLTQEEFDKFVDEREAFKKTKKDQAHYEKEAVKKDQAINDAQAKIEELEGQISQLKETINAGNQSRKEQLGDVAKYNSFELAKEKAIRHSKGNTEEQDFNRRQYLDEHIKEFYEHGGDINNDTHLYQLYKSGLIYHTIQEEYLNQGKVPPNYEYQGKDVTKLLTDAYEKGEEILKNKNNSVDELNKTNEVINNLRAQISDYESQIKTLKKDIEDLNKSKKALENDAKTIEKTTTPKALVKEPKKVKESTPVTATPTSEDESVVVPVRKTTTTSKTAVVHSENAQRAAVKTTVPRITSGATSGEIAAETEAVEALFQIINEVTSAVNKKTDAFKTENTTVSKVVNSEKTKLEELKATLSEIKETLGESLAAAPTKGTAGKTVEQQAEALVKAVSSSLNKIPISFETKTALKELQTALKSERAEIKIIPDTTGFKKKIQDSVKSPVKLKTEPISTGFTKELQKAVKGTPIKIEVKPLADAFAKDLKKLAGTDAAKALNTVKGTGKKKEEATVEISVKAIKEEIKTLKSLSEGINKLLERYNTKRSSELKGIIEYLTEVAAASEKTSTALAKAFSGKSIDKQAIKEAVKNALDIKPVKVKLTPDVKDFMEEANNLLRKRNIKIEVTPVVKNFEKNLRKSIPESQRECRVQVKPNTNSMIADIKRALKKNDFQIKITGTVDEINSVTKDKQFVQKKNDKAVKVVKEEKTADSKSKKSTMADREFNKNIKSSIDSQFKASEEIARANLNGNDPDYSMVARYKILKKNTHDLLKQAKEEGRLADEQIEDFEGYIKEKRRTLRSRLKPDIEESVKRKNFEAAINDTSSGSKEWEWIPETEPTKALKESIDKRYAAKLGLIHADFLPVGLVDKDTIAKGKAEYYYQKRWYELLLNQSKTEGSISERDQKRLEEYLTEKDLSLAQFIQKGREGIDEKKQPNYEVAKSIIAQKHKLETEIGKLGTPQTEAQAKKLAELNLELEKVDENYSKLFTGNNHKYIGDPFKHTEYKKALKDFDATERETQEKIVNTVTNAAAEFNKKKNSTKEMKAEYEAAEKTIKDYHDLKAKTEELKNPQSEAQAKQLGKLKLQLKEVTEAYNKLFDTKNNYIGNPFDGTNLKDSLINLNKEKASQQEEIVKTAEKASTQFYQTEKVKLKDLETLIRQYERIVNNTLSEKGKLNSVEALLDDVNPKKNPAGPTKEFYRKDKTYTPEGAAIANSRLKALTDLRDKYKEPNTQAKIVDEYKDSRDVIEKFRQKDSIYKMADMRKVAQEADRITKYIEANSRISAESKNKLIGHTETLQQALKGSDFSAAQLKEIQKQFYNIDVAERKAGRTGHSFFDILNTKARYLSASILSFYFSWMGIMDFFRKGFETIKEFDSALTEMQKVSNESLNTLKEYQSTSFDLGSAIGTTGLQIQQSTADWQRLGESLTEASKSAQASNVLFNVSEFNSIDEATQSLVAMSSAYEDVSKNIDKMDIVDKLNQVGKLIAQTYGNIWGYNIKYNLVDNYIG